MSDTDRATALAPVRPPTAEPAARARQATDRLRLVAIALALVGVAIAAYLTYVHYAGIDPVCTGDGGCEKVQSSQWSQLIGIPVALLGLLGYLAILGALLLWDGESGRLAVLTAAWLGLAFSVYLQYRALVTVRAECVWCLGSATTMALIAITVTARFVLADDLASAPPPHPGGSTSRAAG